MHRKYMYMLKDGWNENNKQSDHLTTQLSSCIITQHLNVTCQIFNRVIPAGKLLMYSIISISVCKEDEYRAVNTTNNINTNYIDLLTFLDK